MFGSIIADVISVESTISTKSVYPVEAKDPESLLPQFLPECLFLESEVDSGLLKSPHGVDWSPFLPEDDGLPLLPMCRTSTLSCHKKSCY